MNPQIFYRDNKWLLIPEMPDIKKYGYGHLNPPQTTLAYEQALYKAKANALPVANPEIITTDEVPGEPGKPYKEGECYEWPGTFEYRLQSNGKEIAAILILPSDKPNEHTYTDKEIIALAEKELSSLRDQLRQRDELINELVCVLDVVRDDMLEDGESPTGWMIIQIDFIIKKANSLT